MNCKSEICEDVMTISEPMHYIQNYESPLGKIILASDGTCLTGLWFEGQKYDRGGHFRALPGRI